MRFIRLATVALLFLSFGATGFGLPAVSRTQPRPSEENTTDPETFFPIIEDGKLGYINDSGTVVIPPKFKHEDFKHPSRDFLEVISQNRFSDGRAAVQTEDGWGFIDMRGEFVVKPRFERVHPFSEGLAAVQVDELWGFINRSGELVVDFKFAKVGRFREGVSWFFDSVTEKYGVMDRNGQTVISPSFDDPVIFRNGVGEVRSKGEDSAKRVINQQGTTLPFELDRLSLNDWVGDQFVASRGDEYYLIGEGGTIAWGPGDLRELRAKRHALHPPGTLLPILVGDKYGFENADQKIVIPAQFDSAADFSEGMAAVKIDGAWGFIDITGEFVINPRFDGALSFLDGKAFAQTGGYWGVIDQTGNFVGRQCFRIMPNFRSYFLGNKPRPDNRLAPMEFDDENDDTRIGYINRAGEVVWSTKY